MSDTFSIFTLLALLASLLLGIFLAWLLYHNSARLGKNWRYTLAAARTVVFTTIGFLLFFPLIRRVSYQLEKPVILIGQDNSLSVGHVRAADFDSAAYQKEFRKLAADLEKHYDVRVYHFGDSVQPGFDFNNRGRMTDGAGFLRRLSDQFLNRNVGALILASDGIFNSGGNPLYEVDQLKAPVYTVALGDTVPKKDLRISNINYNNLVYLDNDFTIEVQIEAYESMGESTELSVREGAKVIHRQRLPITERAFVKTIALPLRASALGPQKYTIQLSRLPNEISSSNNTQTVVVDVIDARKKILIAAAAPHPDISALKQAVEANKHYEVKVVLAEALSSAKPGDYALVIAYQLPGPSGEGLEFLRALSAEPTAAWFVLGAQTNINAFNQVQKLVNFTGSSNTLQESSVYTNEGFAAFQLSPEMEEMVRKFDPLQVPVGKANLSGNAAVVLQQRIGQLKTGAPVLFFMDAAAKKQAFLIGEGIWRWKLGEAIQDSSSTVFSNLIGNCVQYLSAKDDRRKFKVYPAKTTFDERENLLINAVLYNDSYEPVNDPDVRIQIREEGGRSFNFLFSRTATAYQLDAGALGPGSYTYVASTRMGEKAYRAEGRFFVVPQVIEFQQTTANHQLLHTISAQTGGKMYLPQRLMQIAEDIRRNEQIKTLSYEDRTYEELINEKWIFGMIMALLAMEWFFRKRSGDL